MEDILRESKVTGDHAPRRTKGIMKEALCLKTELTELRGGTLTNLTPYVARKPSGGLY